MDSKTNEKPIKWRNALWFCDQLRKETRLSTSIYPKIPKPGWRVAAPRGPSIMWPDREPPRLRSPSEHHELSIWAMLTGPSSFSFISVFDECRLMEGLKEVVQKPLNRRTLEKMSLRATVWTNGKEKAEHEHVFWDPSKVRKPGDDLEVLMGVLLAGTGVDHIQGFEELLHICVSFGRKPRLPRRRTFFILEEPRPPSKGALSQASAFALDPLASIVQRSCVLCMSVRTCPCEPSFQSSWVLFNSPPRSLSPSPSFTAASHVFLLRANNYSPCLGTLGWNKSE